MLLLSKPTPTWSEQKDWERETALNGDENEKMEMDIHKEQCTDAATSFNEEES